MIYAETDRQIRAMNRKALKAFDRLKILASYDEMNVIREVSNTYDDLTGDAKRRYLVIARTAYTNALGSAGYPKAEAERKALRDVDEAFLMAWLEETNPVLLYRFFPEADRKAQRLAEALAVKPKRIEEIEKAMRAWAFMSGQFAIDITDRANLAALKEAGIQMVKWMTERDGRVCPTCRDRGGRLYRVGNVPDKPHPNCRCFLARA